MVTTTFTGYTCMTFYYRKNGIAFLVSQENNISEFPFEEIFIETMMLTIIDQSNENLIRLENNK